MQDKKYLATIVPLGPQARKQIQKGENLDVIRAAVWSETAKKLTPLLGSVCSRFLPATYAWSICNYRPFGVMLGGVTADMEDMLLCYTRARLEQMNEIEARQQRLIAQGETLLNESPIQSLNITVVSIDSSNPGTRKELELAQKFFSGDTAQWMGISRAFRSVWTMRKTRSGSTAGSPAGAAPTESDAPRGFMLPGILAPRPPT